MTPASGLHIRRTRPSDLDAIEAMERRIFTSPWSREALRPELLPKPDRIGLLAFRSGKPVGYALAWVVADELHLVTIGVDEAHRRQGVARALLHSVQADDRAQDARIMTLEVRASNEAALGFYRSEGFRAVAMRPRYYPDNKEDAVIMLRELDPVDGG